MQSVLFWEPNRAAYAAFARILEKTYTILEADKLEEVKRLLLQETEIAALAVDERYAQKMSAEAYFLKKHAARCPCSSQPTALMSNFYSRRCGKAR